jgi:hypothetical protein
VNCSREDFFQRKRNCKIFSEERWNVTLSSSESRKLWLLTKEEDFGTRLVGG